MIERGSRRRRVLGILGIGMPMLLVAAILGVSYYVADNFVGAGRWTHTLGTDPAALGLRYENASFRTSDGLTLRGWWIAADRPVGTVLLLHGWAHNRTDILPQAPYLHAAGYDLLLFDFRSNGTSDGTVCTFGALEQRDLVAALDFAASRGHGGIAAIGYSMGAVAAIAVGSTESQAGPGPRLSAIVADSAYATFDDLATRGFEQEAHLPLPPFPFVPLALLMSRLETGAAPVQPVDIVARFAPRPILLVSGSNDTLVPPSQADRLAEAAGQPRETLRIDGAGHPSSPVGGPFRVDPARYEARVLAFLHGALGP